MASPYSRQMRRRARKGVWHPDFIKRYGNQHRLPDVTPRCKREIMRAIARGCVVTSTTDGTHAPGSFHYQKVWYTASDGRRRRGGRAVDLGGGWVAMRRYYADVRRREFKHGTQFSEAFGPGNWHIKYGIFQSGQFPGHTDHVHVAPYQLD